MGIGVQITFDSADVDAQARFWAAALDYVLQPPPDGFESWDAFLDSIDVPADQRDIMNAVVDPEGRGPRLLFQKVPEAKAAKNRVHLDVNVGGGREVPDAERRSRVEAKVDELTGLGAVEVRRAEERGEFWIVMADPEGNEFCLQ